MRPHPLQKQRGSDNRCENGNPPSTLDLLSWLYGSRNVTRPGRPGFRGRRKHRHNEDDNTKRSSLSLSTPAWGAHDLVMGMPEFGLGRWGQRLVLDLDSHLPPADAPNCRAILGFFFSLEAANGIWWLLECLRDGRNLNVQGFSADGRWYSIL